MVWIGTAPAVEMPMPKTMNGQMRRSCHLSLRFSIAAACGLSVSGRNGHSAGAVADTTSARAQRGEIDRREQPEHAEHRADAGADRGAQAERRAQGRDAAGALGPRR